jgi:hypothetical protein
MLSYGNQNVGEFGLGEFSSALVKHCDKDHGCQLSSFCTCALNNFDSKILAKTLNLEMQNISFVVFIYFIHIVICGL